MNWFELAGAKNYLIAPQGLEVDQLAGGERVGFATVPLLD